MRCNHLYNYNLFDYIQHNIDYDYVFFISLGKYQSRFFPIKAMSQDFDLEPFTNMNISNTSMLSNSMINIVISCHSHAPLQEFWDRLHINRSCDDDDNDNSIKNKRRMTKIAITMACCSNYAELNDDLFPVLEFDDFEVYSPKRKVKIYFDDR